MTMNFDIKFLRVTLPFSYQKISFFKIWLLEFCAILNVFNKISERCMYNSLTQFVEKFLPVFVSAYRRIFNSNDVFIRLIENWNHVNDIALVALFLTFNIFYSLL